MSDELYCLLSQQAASKTPPSGHKILRLNKTTGVAVLVDSDGTETTLTTGAATADGAANPGLPLKTDANGDAKVRYLKVASLQDPDSPEVLFSLGSVAGYIAVTQAATGVPDAFIPPSSDPGVSGAVWNNAGTLTISSG